MAGVWVSDGEDIRTTDANGAYTLTLAGMDEFRCIHVTPPEGYRSTSAWYRVIRQDDPATRYAFDFGLRPDPRSRDRDFRFLVTADSQFRTEQQGEMLRADFAQVARISGDPRFHFICGDLTMTGWLNEWRLYAAAREAMTLPHYDVFGGHGGNYGKATRLKRGSVHHFNLFCGPSYYSWHYGGRHFVVGDHVHGHTSRKQQARQAKWMAKLIGLLKPGTEIVYTAHYPAALEAWRSRHKVAAFFYGHYHESTTHDYKGTPYICTNAIRGGDWGMFTRAVQVCDFRDGKLLTQIRPAGQYQRLEITYPQPDGAVPQGDLPLRIMAFDTSSVVQSVTAVVRPHKASDAAAAKTLRLTRLGYWTWGAHLDTRGSTPGPYVIQVTVQDDAGQTWQRTAPFRVVAARPAEASPGADWPAFLRSEPSPRAVEGGLRPPLELAWTVNTGGRNEFGSSPIVYRGRVYCGTQNEDTSGPRPAVCCYNAATGKRLWRTEVATSVRFAPAAIADRIIAVDNDGVAYGLDADTGHVLWRTPMDMHGAFRYHTYKSPVLISNGLAVASSTRGPVTLLDPQTGRVVKTCPNPTSGSYYAAPFVQDGRVYISARYATVCCDLTTGKVLWRADTKKHSSRGVGTPFIAGGVLYHNTAGRTLALSPTDGRLLWAAPAYAGGWAVPTPAISDGLLYTGGAHFRGVDLKTGKPKWSFRFEQPKEELAVNRRQRVGGFSSPVVAGDWVFVGSDNGSLYAFDKADGKVAWQFRVGIAVKSSPVVSGNTLFVKDYDGNLYAFACRPSTGPHR